MEESAKSGLFPVFGSQAGFPKLNSAFRDTWSMEQPIVFGQGAIGNRSAERGALGERGGPGSPVFGQGATGNRSAERGALGERRGPGIPVFGQGATGNRSPERGLLGERGGPGAPMFGQGVTRKRSAERGFLGERGGPGAPIFGQGATGNRSAERGLLGERGGSGAPMFGQGVTRERSAERGLLGERGGPGAPIFGDGVTGNRSAERGLLGERGGPSVSMFGQGAVRNRSAERGPVGDRVGAAVPMFGHGAIGNRSAEREVVGDRGGAGAPRFGHGAAGKRSTERGALGERGGAGVSMFGQGAIGNHSDERGALGEEGGPMFAQGVTENRSAEKGATGGRGGRGASMFGQGPAGNRLAEKRAIGERGGPGGSMFGQGAIENHSADKGAIGEKGGPGGPIKRVRERPRSPNNPALKQQNIAQQQVGKGHGKSPDQQREEEAAKERRRVRFGAEFEGKPRTTTRQAVKVEDVDRSHKSPPTTGTVTERQSYTSPSAACIVTPFESGNRLSPIGNISNRETTPVRRMDAMVEETAEMDGLETLTSEAILGVCPDMCPEIERAERERKGDLDRFERVEGDRNQTSVDLAVKKYTRTAEKDAVLIRPLPVLKSTMGHLLSLLERDHEDDLLSVHNFLWDRMRAVRMDLRMQHIFGGEAITMHEQMIRFHILAMHELCEYVQGEAGVSEGFNAHLNIEQMNKTSVDLFQMYEDHGKRGITVPSEAEFRGYYALLKLDKHPGYRVEPAELSLDLAKMSPDIRRSPQVLFARDVARACRGSNYVAFFRLARQATYLQACLMHAHFAKLRTQALASLHSGLLKNQGIPLSTVVDWLGMEEENIEALIQYHGFSIKHYEEQYMVKEGTFLNKDNDFPTCRSQMVEAKRSSEIVADVQSGGQVMPNTGSKLRNIGSFGRNDIKEIILIDGKILPVLSEIPSIDVMSTIVNTVEEDMPDYVDEEEPPAVEAEVVTQPVLYRPVFEVVKDPTEEEGKQSKKRRMKELQNEQHEAEEHEIRRLRHEADAAARRAISQAHAAEAKRQEEKLREAAHKAEADAGKQRRWLRKWRRRAAAKALERKQKLERAEAALDTLSLGVPLTKMRVVAGDHLSIQDRQSYLKSLVKEQGMNLQEHWASINIPSLVLPILQELNPSTPYLYWNLLLSTTEGSVGEWIRTKVGTSKRFSQVEESSEQGDFGTVLADESKIFYDGENGTSVGFRYTARELTSSLSRAKFEVCLNGAGGLIFMLKAEGPVAIEQARLHKLVQVLPDGVSVPLLILSSNSWHDRSREIEQWSMERSWESFLETDEITHSRVSKLRVIFIGKTSEVNVGVKSYYSDQALVEGLHWLAENCPLQPQLRSVHVADLVREHLDGHMRLLLGASFKDVSPEHCVVIYNRALKRAAEEIKHTARLVPLNWPPNPRPQRKWKGEENESTTAADAWNDKKSLDSMFAALESCLLPAFPTVPSFDTGDDLVSQKLELEVILRNYLSTIEDTSPDNPTTRWEVNHMVQRGCTVEWSESGRTLVPKWARIFQAIITGRLLLLNKHQAASVYVSRVDNTPPFHLENFEESFCSPSYVFGEPDSYFDADPLLDDLIGQIAHKQEKKSQFNDQAERELGSPLQMMQSSLNGMSSSRRSSRASDGLQICASSLNPSPAEYKSGSLDGMQEQYIVGSPSERFLPWSFIDSSDSAKRSQLTLTDSELLLDEMMNELEFYKSRTADDEPGLGDYSVAYVTAPSDGNYAEVDQYDDQCSPTEDLRGEDLSQSEFAPQKEREVRSWAFNLELTESEILLDSMLLELKGKKASEPVEVPSLRSSHCNGRAEHVREQHQILSVEFASPKPFT